MNEQHPSQSYLPYIKKRGLQNYIAKSAVREQRYARYLQSNFKTAEPFHIPQVDGAGRSCQK